MLPSVTKDNVLLLVNSCWQALKAGHASHFSNLDWTWKAPGYCGNKGCKQIETWLGVAATILHIAHEFKWDTKQGTSYYQGKLKPPFVTVSSDNTPSQETDWDGGFAGPDAMFSLWDQISPNPGSYANPRLKEAREWNKRKSLWSRLLIKATASSRWAAPPTAWLLACQAGQRLRC